YGTMWNRFDLARRKKPLMQKNLSAPPCVDCRYHGEFRGRFARNTTFFTLLIRRFHDFRSCDRLVMGITRPAAPDFCFSRTCLRATDMTSSENSRCISLLGHWCLAGSIESGLSALKAAQL